MLRLAISGCNWRIYSHPRPIGSQGPGQRIRRHCHAPRRHGGAAEFSAQANDMSAGNQQFTVNDHFVQPQAATVGRVPCLTAIALGLSFCPGASQRPPDPRSGLPGVRQFDQICPKGARSRPICPRQSPCPNPTELSGSRPYWLARVCPGPRFIERSAKGHFPTR